LIAGKEGNFKAWGWTLTNLTKDGNFINIGVERPFKGDPTGS
jgi:hypothetical protein